MPFRAGGGMSVLPSLELALETRYRRAIAHLARLETLSSFNQGSRALLAMTLVARQAIEEIENQFLADDPGYSEFLERCAAQERLSAALQREENFSPEDL